MSEENWIRCWLRFVRWIYICWLCKSNYIHDNCFPSFQLLHVWKIFIAILPWDRSEKYFHIAYKINWQADCEQSEAFFLKFSFFFSFFINFNQKKSLFSSESVFIFYFFFLHFMLNICYVFFYSWALNFSYMFNVHISFFFGSSFFYSRLHPIFKRCLFINETFQPNHHVKNPFRY